MLSAYNETRTDDGEDLPTYTPIPGEVCCRVGFQLPDGIDDTGMTGMGMQGDLYNNP